MPATLQDEVDLRLRGCAPIRQTIATVRRVDPAAGLVKNECLEKRASLGAVEGISKSPGDRPDHSHSARMIHQSPPANARCSPLDCAAPFRLTGELQKRSGADQVVFPVARGPNRTNDRSGRSQVQGHILIFGRCGGKNHL